MRKAILLIPILTLIFPSVALANSTGSVSNSVNITNNVNTSNSTSTSSTANNNTHVRIETNGQLKEYNGSDGNVDMSSDDGHSQVHISTYGSSTPSSTNQSNSSTNTNIHTETNSGNSTEPSPSASSSVSPSPSPTPQPLSQSNSGLFSILEHVFDNLKQSLLKIFS